MLLFWSPNQIHYFAISLSSWDHQRHRPQNQNHSPFSPLPLQFCNLYLSPYIQDINCIRSQHCLVLATPPGYGWGGPSKWWFSLLSLTVIKRREQPSPVGFSQLQQCPPFEEGLVSCSVLSTVFYFVLMPVWSYLYYLFNVRGTFSIACVGAYIL